MWYAPSHSASLPLAASKINTKWNPLCFFKKEMDARCKMMEGNLWRPKQFRNVHNIADNTNYIIVSLDPDRNIEVTFDKKLTL